MRLSYLLFIAAIASLDAVCAKQGTVTSVEAATQPNSISAGTSKRFLRSHKWFEDDANAENEERNKGTNALTKLLKEGKSPGQGEQAIKAMSQFSADQQAKLVERYAEMYRKKYSLFNGKKYTGA
ncbi:hypothetical protein PHMEG_00020254 [Phytophthora megakarya]|uniref:RxLR effector protein n=1 Tax=Phytophthora megakarya TaxID=4795 RepID=A0A225VQQ3_9STRA|nr:hypothetical protein PHMEG_00020254 [Phytophthora megakarya]